MLQLLKQLIKSVLSLSLEIYIRHGLSRAKVYGLWGTNLHTSEAEIPDSCDKYKPGFSNAI